MKGITFAVAFVSTVCVVIGGVLLYPNILGQAATSHNDYVFALFIGPFFVFLFFAWIGEKVFLKIAKKKS
jgi:hypothetical protein